ncbi:GPI-anchored small secreted protein [Mycena sanguinolenta]|nr:GPI-anchored small secreted protein [Mycena sanguinolenta]
MFSPLAILAAFVASVSAISIITPNPSKGWTNDGSNTITWSSVSTDPSNFTILLENHNTTAAPVPQQLAALVVTSTGKVTVNPPSEGWPAVGGNYVVRFVASSEQLNTQLAQSQAFSIEPPAVSSGSTTQASTPATPVTPATLDAGAGASSTDSSSPSATGASAAVLGVSVHTGLVGALALLSAFLAQL